MKKEELRLEISCESSADDSHEISSLISGKCNGDRYIYLLLQCPQKFNYCICGSGRH